MAAIAYEFVPTKLQSIWGTTSITRAEKEFPASMYNHLLNHSDYAGMAVEYNIETNGIGSNGYDTGYDIVPKVDDEFLVGDDWELDGDVALEFAELWVTKLVEVIGEAQETTTLSPKEFVTFILMNKTSCNEKRAADALGISVGTYRGKKGRIKSKREECTETAILERLTKQPTRTRFRNTRTFGEYDDRISAIAPSDIYDAQLAVSRRDSHSYTREPVEDRDHDTYEQVNWRTAHVDRVDNLFVADNREADSMNIARLDFDGYGDPGADMHREGENIQVSAWLREDKARELYEQLEEKFDF